MLPATERMGTAAPEASNVQGFPPTQVLVSVVFDASALAVKQLTHLVPGLDRDRTEYAIASVLLEEAWVSSR